MCDIGRICQIILNISLFDFLVVKISPIGLVLSIYLFISAQIWEITHLLYQCRVPVNCKTAINQFDHSLHRYAICDSLQS